MIYKMKPARSLIIDRLTAKQKLIAEHGKKCGYCGVELPFDQMLEIDYYVPGYVKGKPSCELYHTLGDENFVLSCSICNRIKGIKLPINDDGFVTILHPYKDNYNEVIVVDDNGEVRGLTDSAVSTINELRLNRPELVEYRCANIASIIDRVNDTCTAFTTYSDSRRQIVALLSINISDKSQEQYFHRMIYANVIGAMEAYLSKTLISLVLNDENVFWKFVECYDWQNEKIRIEDIKKTYDQLNIKVQTELTEVLYHNLPKVKSIYQVVLGIDIWKDKPVMKALCKAVEIRHDLVHRNGRKKSSISPQEFHNITTQMIEELIANVDKLVECVELQLAESYVEH